MDNQHQKIKGYRELNQVEIDLMNEIKSKGVELEALVKKAAEHAAQQFRAADNAEDGTEFDRISAAEPQRWVAMARSDFQTGLMKLTRAIAQPTTF